MKRLLVLLLCISVLSACGEKKPASYELCGYGDMMVVGDKEYVKVSVEKKLTLDEKIGAIKEKIETKYHPVNDFTTNTLPEGTPIYSVKDHKQYLIAQTKDNRYLLYEEIH
ncbi:hypothetical protein [Bacillus sp. KH172YL63]|uniref:hypothetical protein n=1 Tax=Bacillus sp. KH172YL63 TaxID=2709784 RepID=UPI0013E4D034|nr:hypothetical protein [Bacillus sp. KH172YL63]BCB05355.1 hypothetical protein KH172YL63_34880 [Bacillus sp. KH172YL63]